MFCCVISFSFFFLEILTCLSASPLPCRPSPLLSSPLSFSPPLSAAAPGRGASGSLGEPRNLIVFWCSWRTNKCTQTQDPQHTRPIIQKESRKGRRKEEQWLQSQHATYTNKQQTYYTCEGGNDTSSAQLKAYFYYESSLLLSDKELI